MTGAVIARAYDPAQADTWNAFVAQSKNATFLQDRRFMDYHADRFADHSLVFESDDKLVALLPANRVDDQLVSHGGLTYGGLIASRDMTAARMIDVVAALGRWMRDHGLARLYYKAVPHVFHKIPAEEDIYALQRCGARLERCDMATVVDLRNRIPFNSLRKRGVKKALKAGLECRQSADFATYWDMLAQRLLTRHDVRPTHDLAEIKLLWSRFPDHLRLFAVFDGNEMVAGIVTFDFGTAVHAQYIASSERGRELGGLDLLVHYLLDTIFAKRNWFSFGTSTTQGGRELNVGLARQKEMFGGRSVIFPHYTWSPENGR